LINKRIERDRTFFDALRRLGFAGQSGFGNLTARDAGVAFAAAVKREYDGKPTKRTWWYASPRAGLSAGLQREL